MSTSKSPYEVALMARNEGKDWFEVAALLNRGGFCVGFHEDGSKKKFTVKDAQVLIGGGEGVAAVDTLILDTFGKLESP